MCSKKIKGAVFFDYDGTLTDKNEKIFLPTSATLDALKKLRQNGYIIVLATGRSLKYVPQSGIDFDCVISENGSYTVDINESKVLSDIHFDNTLLKDIASFCEEHDCIYVLENAKSLYVNSLQSSLFKKMIGLFDVPHSLFTQINFSGSLNEFEKVNKILLIYKDHEIFNRFYSLFSTKTVITKPDTSITSCDINPKGVSKSDGIKAVCDHYGIELENTYAFGDGQNDYSMLYAVKHGVAMGMHNKALESVCEHITDTVRNEGVSKALSFYGII